MILMFTIAGKADAGTTPSRFWVGFAGLATRSRRDAGRRRLRKDSLETGEGFTNYLSVIGIVETVAIFVMVFVIIAL